jgi:hypothetical protein
MKRHLTVVITWGIIGLVALLLGPQRHARGAVPREAPVVMNTLESLERAIGDLAATFGERYPKGAEYRKRLAALKKAGAKAGDPQVEQLRSEALLANPLLDFDRLLLIRRRLIDFGKGGTMPSLGLPLNYEGNCTLRNDISYDNDIALLSPVSPQGKLTTVYRPPGTELVLDLCLHFDGDRLLFSMPLPVAMQSVPPSRAGQAPPRRYPGAWQVWEVKLARETGAVGAAGLRQVTRSEIAGTQNYMGIYLPSGKILYGSTAPRQGVPCVNGGAWIALLHAAGADVANVRQLAFDQDHNWYPAVMNDGRVMYTRWEYSDTPHYFTRLIFQMRPDGTAQMPLYGSNSYWPTAMFYAKPIPGHPSKFAAIVSGHHGVHRMGELVIFDPAKGRHEADGVVQRIPGYGRKVEPVVADALVDASWPKFLYPWPLSDNYFLVSMLTQRDGLWGVYLVDVFDNAVLIHQEPGMALMEPVPLKKRPCPPVLADTVDTKRKDATVLLTNIYAGDGLKGVPRGTVKRLRVYSHHSGRCGDERLGEIAGRQEQLRLGAPRQAV